MLNIDLPPEVNAWLHAQSSEKKVWAAANELLKENRFRRASSLLYSDATYATTMTHRHRVMRTLLHAGMFPACLAIAKSLLEDEAIEEYPKIKHAAQHTIGLVEQIQTGSAFLRRALPIEKPKGFVLFYNVQNPVVSGLMVPLAFELARLGYASAAAVHSTISTPRTGIAAFDALSSCIAPDGQSFVSETPNERLRNTWSVNWPAKRIMADGIDYFAYFHERVAQKARKYTVDIDTDEDAARYFRLLLKQADVALTFCKRLIEVSAHGPVRVALTDSHFAPAGIIRKWCYDVGVRHQIHTVAMGVSYENYFSNLSTSEAGTLVIDDLTAQPTLRAPVLGGVHRLNQFLASEPEVLNAGISSVLPWVNQDRSLTVTPASERDEILDRIRSVRAAGNKVFLAMGKVSIDFAAPGDRGLAHVNFIEWVAHLSDTIGQTNNLLLIKPHPHELRKEIVVNGVQMLRELVPETLPENVIFLPHNAFNSYEIAGDINAVLLWNGMGTVEFPILGVPVIPASIWNEHDYPVGTETLKTREEYEEFLSGRREVSVSPELQARCVGYLHFLRSEFLGIPFRYVRRAAVNAYIGPPVLYPEDLQRLDRDGDPHVRRAAERFFEFT